MPAPVFLPEETTAPLKTIRQQLLDLLRNTPASVRELSQALHQSEKEVYAHLVHIEQTAQTRGQRLLIDPPRCLACGFAFQDRKRFTPPGHCPECRSTRISRPRYRLG